SPLTPARNPTVSAPGHIVRADSRRLRWDNQPPRWPTTTPTWQSPQMRPTAVRSKVGSPNCRADRSGGYGQEARGVDLGAHLLFARWADAVRRRLDLGARLQDVAAVAVHYQQAPGALPQVRHR